MTGPAISEATVLRADHLATGGWGNDAVLTLVFELSDGRTTQPTYIPGQWQIADFLEMVDVASIENLVGIELRVVLLDSEAQVPMVTEVLASTVPDPFRKAFEDDP
jgi:hypothetical protein